MVSLIYRKFFTYTPEKLFFLKDKFWIKSIFWDVFWFHSGIWISIILIIVKPSLFIEIFYAIGVFMFWIAHRFSSFYLACGPSLGRGSVIHIHICWPNSNFDWVKLWRRRGDNACSADVLTFRKFFNVESTP